MPQPSPSLQEEATKSAFDEIHEIVRQFIVWKEDPRIKVRVTLSRYYTQIGRSHYSLDYEIGEKDGSWRQHDFGQVLNGSDSKEQSIKVALSFIKEAYRPKVGGHEARNSL